MQAVFSKDWKIVLGLVLLTLTLFAPAVRYDFINLDDPEYVFKNPHVLTGLRLENLRWAVTQIHESWWLPLLWISYMADVSFFGPAPWGFHLTNILLHTASVLLLFLVLRRATGRPGPSAFVAALFAIHPLRLESVVWITERKDTLSGFFWMLGLLAHVRYAEKPSFDRYWPVPLCMALGLMSKATLVTFPPTLLLLDFWPLRRFEPPGAWKKVLQEKVPLFILSAAFVAITVSTHASGRGRYAGLSWLERLNLVPRNYLGYLGKLLWPVRLAIIYPENDLPRWGLFFVASFILLAITGLCFWQARRRPFLLMGWLWFGLTLFPVVRGVRLGLASMADRFTYIPSIGLFVLAAWGFLSLLPEHPWRPALIKTVVGMILVAALATSAWNLRFWQNSVTLFQRALAITSRNYLAAFNLANHLLSEGRQAEALAYYQKTIELGRGTPQADHLIAAALYRLDRLDEAAALFEQGLRRSDQPAEIHSNLGLIAFQQNQFDKAIGHFGEAIRMDPGLADAHFNLGLALIKLGRGAEALAPLQRAAELNPWDDASRFLLGQLLEEQGRRAEALSYYQAAWRLQPDREDYRAAVNALRSP